MHQISPSDTYKQNPKPFPMPVVYFYVPAIANMLHTIFNGVSAALKEKNLSHSKFLLSLMNEALSVPSKSSYLLKGNPSQSSTTM